MDNEKGDGSEFREVPADRLLTTAEVAAYLQVPEAWVRAHSNGKREPTVPSFKVGHFRRYSRRQIDRWLKRLAGPGGTNAAA